MIEVNELRIGNWVHYPNLSITESAITYCGSIRDLVKSNDLNICDIAYINDDLNDPNKYTGKYPIDTISPIYLTDKILLKCGFKNKKDTYIKDLGTAIISVYYYPDSQWNVCIDYPLLSTQNNTIKHGLLYLHQIQNYYFELIGKELEINL